MGWIFWIAVGWAGTLVAVSRGGHGFLWLVVGTFLGPITWPFALTFAGDDCPFCRSRIHDRATRCPKCCGDIKAQKMLG